VSFTIHDIDEKLDNRLSEQARISGKSKNKLVKELLAQAVGLSTEEGFADDYREFCGLWLGEGAADFEAVQFENDRIDEEDWR
jgi:hypothetical protein